MAIDKNREVIAASPQLGDLWDIIAAKGLDFGRDIDVKFLTANKRWHLRATG